MEMEPACPNRSQAKYRAPIAVWKAGTLKLSLHSRQRYPYGIRFHARDGSIKMVYLVPVSPRGKSWSLVCWTYLSPPSS
jgi:hypothetical protein